MEPTQSTEGGSPESTPVATPATHRAEGTEAHSPTLMGMLAYIGPLVLIPFFIAKDDSFVLFHIKQGLVLFVIELILWVLDELMLWHFLWPIVTLTNFVLLILSIIGIINVLQKKEQQLPLVGAYSKHFKV